MKDPETGYMVVCPSNSPENHPGIGNFTKSDGKTANIALFGGVAMDNEMVYDLLKNTALAARALDRDADFADALDNRKAQITTWRPISVSGSFFNSSQPCSLNGRLTISETLLTMPRCVAS